MTNVLKKLTPNIMVEDVNGTVQFYKDVLSFQVLASVPEEGTFNWVMLGRDDVQLMVQSRTSLTEELPLLQGKAIGGTLTFYIDVSDIQGLYEQIRGKASIVQGMHTAFYGAQEFAIQDNNGYILVFAQTA